MIARAVEDARPNHFIQVQTLNNSSIKLETCNHTTQLRRLGKISFVWNYPEFTQFMGNWLFDCVDVYQTKSEKGIISPLIRHSVSSYTAFSGQRQCHSKSNPTACQQPCRSVVFNQQYRFNVACYTLGCFLHGQLHLILQKIWIKFST